MLIHKAFKYRLYPNQEQQAKLNIQFGHSRFVYNHFLVKREEAYQATGKGLSYNQMAKLLTQLKREPEHSWLKEADSQLLQESLKDLDTAYKNFFDKKKTKTGKYFASIQVEIEIEDPIYNMGVIGLDLGLKDFAVTSKGKRIPDPKHL